MKPWCDGAAAHIRRQGVEADLGQFSTARFVINFTQPLQRQVTFQYQVLNGTATSGVDFPAIGTQTITLVPGQVNAFIDVRIIGDNHFEGDETFSVRIFNPIPNDVTISDATANGLIIDNDQFSFDGQYTGFYTGTASIPGLPGGNC